MIRFICVITLDDFTLDNGSTQYIPKSHLLLRKPSSHDQELLSSPTTVTAPAGSLITWNGALWHRSSENKTEKPRSCLILSFASSLFMEICGEEEHLTVIPRSTIESWPPHMQALVGFKRAIKRGALYLPDN